MIKLIKEVPLWNAGYVKQYDFSEANSSEESRIEHVCAVARVCRGDKTPVKSDKELYQQLLTEHDGKPGSVFEFVPVDCYPEYDDNNQMRFGTMTNTAECFTNLRACLADAREKGFNDYDLYDTITDGFFVFKVKVPQMIVKHILRHRMLSFQEMSERTNKLREYYYCDELKDILDLQHEGDEIMDKEKSTWNEICYEASQCDFDLWQSRFKIRQELLNKGSHGLAYTTLWVAGWKQDLNGYQNFFNVRCSKPAQKEIIELATIMKNMMEE